MSVETKIPVVTAEASWINCYWRLKIKCPHCGEVHVHGGGVGSKPSGGHRLAHCAKKNPDNPGYTIEIGKTKV